MTRNDQCTTHARPAGPDLYTVLSLVRPEAVAVAVSAADDRLLEEGDADEGLRTNLSGWLPPLEWPTVVNKGPMPMGDPPEVNPSSLLLAPSLGESERHLVVEPVDEEAAESQDVFMIDDGEMPPDEVLIRSGIGALTDELAGHLLLWSIRA